MQILKSQDNKIISICDKKNIIVATYQNTETKKIYNTFQINLPISYINLIENIGTDQQTNFYLKEINKQQYEIKQTTTNINTNLSGLIPLTLPTNLKKRLIRLTLPKNNIEYLQAYEKYISVANEANLKIDDVIFIEREKEINEKTAGLNPKEAAKVIDKITKPYHYKFNLTADIKLILEVNNNTAAFDTTFILTLNAEIDNKFVEYVKEVNNNMLPEWLDFLLTDHIITLAGE
jgi:hypothetical protein